MAKTKIKSRKRQESKFGLKLKPIRKYKNLSVLEKIVHILGNNDSDSIFAASGEFYYPTTSTSINWAGGSQHWLTPENAIVDNDDYTYISVGSNTTTELLKVYGHPKLIPDDATIIGWQVIIEKSSEISAVTDITANVLIGGVSYGSYTNPDIWSTDPTDVIYGSATDMSGLLITPADINGGLTGFQISANINSFGNIRISRVRIAYYYTTP